MGKPEGVLFVTVGTSALTARRLGETNEESFEGSKNDVFLRDKVQNYLKDVHGRGTGEADLLSEVVKAHRNIWKSVGSVPNRLIPRGPSIGDQIERTSAEMTSTYFLSLTGEVPEGFLGKSWKVILLASSTPEGHLAARINARLFHDFLLSQPCRCTFADPVGCASGRVMVVRVPGLDEKGFTGSISQNLLEILDVNRSKHVICNITGGFKGTIPIIAVWAFRHGYPLFYQHERARECVKISFDVRSRLVEERRYPLTAFPTPDSLG